MELKNFSTNTFIRIIIILLFTPLLFVFSLYSFVLRGEVVNNIEANNRGILLSNKQDLEENLSRLEVSLSSLVAYDASYKKSLNYLSDLAMYDVAYDLKSKFDQMISQNPMVMGISYYSKKNEYQLARYNSGYTLEEKSEVDQFLNNQMEEGPYVKSWNFYQIANKGYLIRTVGVKNTYLSLVIDLEHLDQVIEHVPGSFVFSTSEGVVLASSAIDFGQLTVKNNKSQGFIERIEDEKFLVVQEEITFPNSLYYSYVAQYPGFWQQVPNSWLVLMLLIFLAILTMLFVYWLLKKTFFTPIEYFSQSINRMKNGEECILSEENVLEELNNLSHSFNTSINEVKQLQQLAYEQKMKNQEIQLQKLQIQLRPHFFLNCLNSIFGLAQEKNYIKIQEMIIHLSSFLRYLLTDSSQMMTFQKELEMVINYLQLQQISAAYDIEFHQNISDFNEIKELMIPQMSILTFVENSIKHAAITHQKLIIDFKVMKLIDQNKTFLNIVISDNGEGFSEEILEMINKETLESSHIGIANVKKRLRFIYGNQATLYFSNNTKGAVVNLFIPIDEGGSIK